MKLTEKTKEKTRVVFSGAGAASIAVAQLLLEAGFKNLALCDRHGLLYPGRPKGMNEEKTRIAQIINPEGHQGDLSHALKGADVFIGLSAAGLLTGEMVEAMAKDPIIFACANPDPEIDPEIAREKGAYIVATGRSDYPNQINKLVFRDLRGADAHPRSMKNENGRRLCAGRHLRSR